MSTCATPGIGGTPGHTGTVANRGIRICATTGRGCAASIVAERAVTAAGVTVHIEITGLGFGAG